MPPLCADVIYGSPLKIKFNHLLGSAGVNLENVNWWFCLSLAILTKASTEWDKRRGNGITTQGNSLHQLPVDFTLWARVKNGREKLWPGINFCLWIILTITVAWYVNMMCLKTLV